MVTRQRERAAPGTRRRPAPAGGRPLLALFLAATLAAGVASADSRPGRGGKTVMVTGVAAEADGGMARLLITADGPLAWTTYRTVDDDLVVELVGAVIAAGVEGVVTADGLIESVALERGQASLTRRPMVRMTIVTRSEAVYSLDAIGSGLRLSFRPVADGAGADRPAPAGSNGGDDVVASGRVGSGASGLGVDADGDAARTGAAPPPVTTEIEEETLPDEPSGDEPATVTAVDASAPEPAAPEAAEPASSEPASSEPEPASPEPVEPASVGSSPSEPPEPASAGLASGVLGSPPGDALLAIEASAAPAGVTVRLIGNGEPDFAQLTLRAPPRFVIDLHGVVNRVSVSTLPLDSELVTRVRVGQFQATPRPIARVVLDLGRADLEPRVERAGDDLVIRVVAP